MAKERVSLLDLQDYKMVLRSPKTDASLSSLKTIYLSGKAPWGFRIIDLKTSMGSSNIVVSKVC